MTRYSRIFSERLWSAGIFFGPFQLDYILDTEGPETELTVRTQKACLTRDDFWTLGSDVTYFLSFLVYWKCIIEIVFQKKNIYIAVLYVVSTWRRPTLCDPLSTLKLAFCFLNSRNLCQSVDPGTWRETTGLDIKVIIYSYFIICQCKLQQPYGVDCGILILMYTLYTVLEAPYDFTVVSSFALSKFSIDEKLNN
uniref:Uncharacterized protein n=1 Tax=Gouania willdenowi TaxID=441366 RepID=A0A8C5E8P6_GOUWI